VIPYLTIALAACSLFATAYMNFMRPARKRRKAELAVDAPKPNFAPNRPTGPTPPDGRIPRDLDRPYPRPKGGRRKLDKTCPVCGTGDETTALDGRVLGWRAHASCAEWLGDWKPKTPAGGGEYAAEPSGHCDPGPIPVGPVLRHRTGGTNTIRYAGGPSGGGAGGSGGSGSVQVVRCENGTTDPLVLMTQRGMISIDEARAQIITAFGVPGPVLGPAVDYADPAALGHLVALQEMFLDSEMRRCNGDPGPIEIA
jgi:hypothetical protein